MTKIHRRRRWTDAEDSILRERYPHEATAIVAEALGRDVRPVYQRAAKLRLSKTEAFYASDRSGRVQQGKQHERMRATQFKKGAVPPNKGLRRPGWAPGRMAETQFKKGRKAEEARNYLPIGTERITKDGFLERKVTDDPTIAPARRWVAVHRLVWQEANGAVPHGFAVAFRAGRKCTDPSLITLDAVELISRAELMRRNSYHTNYPKEVAQLIQLKGALSRKINRRSQT